MIEYPVIEHLLIVGLPGSFKDVTAVKFCKEGHENSKKIFSNQWLGFPHYYLKKNRDLKRVYGDVWNPAIFYIHDIGNVFNARDWWKDNSTTDVRKLALNNYRKRGVQIIGTLHRENELDIDLRVGCIRWFIYPKVIRFNKNMEDHKIILRWYDKPEMYDKGKKPKFKTVYENPARYVKLYNTLEENNLGHRPFKVKSRESLSAVPAVEGFGEKASPRLVLD